MPARRDGFAFLGSAERYLRLETADFGLESIRVRRLISSGHRYQFANAHEDWVIVTWPSVGTMSVETNTGTVTARPGQCVFVPPSQRVVTIRTGAGHFVANRLMVSWAALVASVLARMDVSTQALQQCVQSIIAGPSGSRLYGAVCELLAPSATPVTMGGGSDARRYAIEEFVLGLTAAALVEAGALDLMSGGQRPHCSSYERPRN